MTIGTGFRALVAATFLAAATSAAADTRCRALHDAVYWGETDRVAELLDIGADVDCRQRGGITPLMYAVEQGRLDVARVLLENGANTKLRNDNGLTALGYARFLREAGRGAGGAVGDYASVVDLLSKAAPIPK